MEYEECTFLFNSLSIDDVFTGDLEKIMYLVSAAKEKKKRGREGKRRGSILTSFLTTMLLGILRHADDDHRHHSPVRLF